MKSMRLSGVLLLGLALLVGISGQAADQLRIAQITREWVGTTVTIEGRITDAQPIPEMPGAGYFQMSDFAGGSIAVKTRTIPPVDPTKTFIVTGKVMIDNSSNVYIEEIGRHEKGAFGGFDDPMMLIVIGLVVLIVLILVVVVFMVLHQQKKAEGERKRAEEEARRQKEELEKLRGEQEHETLITKDPIDLPPPVDLGTPDYYGFLTIEEGDPKDKLKRFEIAVRGKRNEFVLGRGSSAQFQVDTVAASREQFKLVVAQGAVSIIALSSKIPTYLNSEPVTTRGLCDGDLISFGSTILRVHLGR